MYMQRYFILKKESRCVVVEQKCAPKDARTHLSAPRAIPAGGMRHGGTFIQSRASVPAARPLRPYVALRRRGFVSSSGLRSLSELENTDRCMTYRTDPVQVRSCPKKRGSRSYQQQEYARGGHKMLLPCPGSTSTFALPEQVFGKKRRTGRFVRGPHENDREKRQRTLRHKWQLAFLSLAANAGRCPRTKGVVRQQPIGSVGAWCREHGIEGAYV